MATLDDIFQPGQNVPMAQLKSYLQAQEDGVAALDLASAGRDAPNSAFDSILADIPIVSAIDGSAQAGVDLDALFQANYVGVGTAKYVAPWGSDSNNGNGWSTPYLTAGKIRTVSCDTAYFAPGEYQFADWRHDDTGGTSPRRFVAPFGGARFMASGTAVSGLTFTANGTYPSVYESALADPPTVHRLLRTDFIDIAGKGIPLPCYLTLAALATAGYGWCHDTTANMLYVCMGGSNVESFKANLKAIYIDATNNRLLLYGPSISYFEGFEMECFAEALAITGTGSPISYFKSCRFEYTYSHSLLAEGATLYSQDCTTYRSAADGGNYNLGPGSEACKWAEINLRTLYNGDEDSYPGQASNPQGASAYNKNGSSNHNAVGIRIGGFHDQSSGPLLSDVLTSGVRSKTWNVGVGLGRSRAPVSSGISYGLLVQNADAWVEEMSVPSSATGGIFSDGSAIINNHNLRGLRSGTGTFTPYTPVAA